MAITLNINPVIRSVAAIVREKLENYAQDIDYPDDLCGLCALGSATLQYALLRKHKIITKVVWGCGNLDGVHCFVEYDNKYIIDITATQFYRYGLANAPVVITSKNNQFYHQFYNPIHPRHSTRPIFPVIIHSPTYLYYFELWDDEVRPTLYNIRDILKNY